MVIGDFPTILGFFPQISIFLQVAFCDKLLLNKLDLVSSEEAIRCKVHGVWNNPSGRCPGVSWAGCVCGVFGLMVMFFGSFVFFCLFGDDFRGWGFFFFTTILGGED